MFCESSLNSIMILHVLVIILNVVDGSKKYEMSNVADMNKTKIGNSSIEILSYSNSDEKTYPPLMNITYHSREGYLQKRSESVTVISSKPNTTIEDLIRQDIREQGLRILGANVKSLKRRSLRGQQPFKILLRNESGYSRQSYGQKRNNTSRFSRRANNSIFNRERPKKLPIGTLRRLIHRHKDRGRLRNKSDINVQSLKVPRRSGSGFNGLPFVEPISQGPGFNNQNFGGQVNSGFDLNKQNYRGQGRYVPNFNQQNFEAQGYGPNFYGQNYGGLNHRGLDLIGQSFHPQGRNGPSFDEQNYGAQGFHGLRYEQSFRQQVHNRSGFNGQGLKVQSPNYLRSGGSTEGSEGTLDPAFVSSSLAHFFNTSNTGTEGKGADDKHRFSIKESTTTVITRTRAMRLSFTEDCDYLMYYCMRAFVTGKLCARSIYYYYRDFENYCEVDYVNCMEKFEVWRVTHMGVCFNITVAKHYSKYPWSYHYFMDGYIVDESSNTDDDIFPGTEQN